MAFLEQSFEYSKWVNLNPDIKTEITGDLRQRDPKFVFYNVVDLLAIVTDPLRQEKVTKALFWRFQDLAQRGRFKQFIGTTPRDNSQQSIEIYRFRADEFELSAHTVEEHGILICRNLQTSDSEYERARNLLVGSTNERLMTLKLDALCIPGANVCYGIKPASVSPDKITDPNSPLNNQLRAILNAIPDFLT